VGAQTQPRLDRVTPGVGDIGPSSVDTRIAPPDLRQPVGFEGVYRVGTPTPGALDARPLVRISGATLALFPRSAYMVTRDGPLPQIPAGTVFYLGHLPEEFTRPPPPTPPSMLALPLGSHALELNLSADLPRADGAPAERGPTSMFSDEGFRRGRVAELLSLPVK
jgi:hypothetical protein